TYYYINAVPQWQAFNNGNWKYLEFATRDLAEAHGTDLTIYTGGWGVLTLDDINANPVEIYLGLTENKMVVPAPAVTWKVVYEESSSRAAAVVGVNNPH
ncbi:DNA/RNA non-specific endonuclease, partial [Aphanizomenon sp. 202]|nr:DNA/RNA non-specific endonuclease [Aphanizomenon sp. 202]